MQIIYIFKNTIPSTFKHLLLKKSKAVRMLKHKYLSANSIIVDPHTGVYVTWRSSGIQPVPGKTYPKPDIMTTASPFPGVL